MKPFQTVSPLGLLCALFLGTGAYAQAPGGEMPPPAVTVVTMTTEDVTLTATLPGRVLASAEAELRPQVNGIVTERMFEEGTRVEMDQPLYKIDPRTYQAAVAQAEAALAQATAQADAARREADRVVALRDRRVASEQTQDSAVAARDAADAAVAAAEASLTAAQINLENTTIKAPLDGVIGLALTSQGALVTASQANALAVIRRIDPVHVDVTQSAAEIVRWQKMGGHASLAKDADQTVTLRLADGSEYDQTGALTAAEPHVDETTGVVTLRMAFANPDGLLLPGMYVLAVIPQTVMENVVLAPQEGVSRDRRGRPVALVVNAENVVEQRALEIVQDHGNRWVVREGLASGDRLIVAGLQSIGPGMTVTPEERQDAPEGEAAAAPAAEGAAPAADAPEGEARSDEAPAGEAAAGQTPATDAPAADAAPTDGAAPADAPAEGAASAEAAPADAPAEAASEDAAAPEEEPAGTAGN